MAQLLDQWGRPVSTRALQVEQAAPTVTGVRQVISGHPAQGLTPKRLASLLREAEDGDPTRYLDLAEEMEEKDLHYLSAISTRKRQVAQLQVTVEPGDESAEAMRQAEFVRAWLAREELADELVDILDAVGKGFSATEIIWETSERQWLPARLEWRFPQWFLFDREDGRTLMLRGETGLPEPLAPFKFIVHQANVKSGLAIRGGLARAAAWAYLFKNYDIKDWVGFVEVYGQPIRVGKYHPGATEDEKDVLLRAVSSIGTDAAAIVPSTMLIEFITDTTKGTAATDLYEKLALYLDRQVSKAVLGQTLTSEPGDSGSLALGQVHGDVREDIERSDAKQLAATLNRDLVRPVIDLNFGPQRVYPRAVIGRPEEEDLEFVVKSVAELVPLGFQVGQRQMRERLGFQEMAEDDTPLSGPAVPALGRAEREAAAQRRPVRPGGPKDDVDRVVLKLERAARAEVEGLVDAVRRSVDEAEDFTDLESRLAAVAGRFGVLDMADLIGQGLLLAELAGRDDILAEAGDAGAGDDG